MASQSDAPFDAHTVKTLLAMARTLYPHDFLDDGPYANVIEIVAREADADRVALLRDGAQALDATAKQPFSERSEDERVAALKEIEGSPFFEDMRGSTVRHLYNNPDVWPHFGYEGPSAHLGGYVKRGFNDISWISDEDIGDG
jgi:hypothetical protein